MNVLLDPINLLPCYKCGRPEPVHGGLHDVHFFECACGHRSAARATRRGAAIEWNAAVKKSRARRAAHERRKQGGA